MSTLYSDLQISVFSSQVILLVTRSEVSFPIREMGENMHKFKITYTVYVTAWALMSAGVCLENMALCATILEHFTV